MSPKLSLNVTFKHTTIKSKILLPECVCEEDRVRWRDRECVCVCDVGGWTLHVAVKPEQVMAAAAEAACSSARPSAASPAQGGIYWQQGPARNSAGCVCVRVFVVVRLYSISLPPGWL